LSFAPEDARAGDLVFQLTPEPATILTYVSAADPLFLKLDVHTRSGTPGGPLVNMSGAVIGVVMAHLRSKDGPISNTSFAVPAKLAARVAEALRTKGKVDRGWLGLQMQNVSPDVAQRLGLLEPKGMLIAKVFEGGPGSAAGLKIGDVVLQINDLRVLDAADFARKLDNFPPGATVRLNIVRGGQVQVLDAKVGLLPPR
jgi:serine protease Do